MYIRGKVMTAAEITVAGQEKTTVVLNKAEIGRAGRVCRITAAAQVPRLSAAEPGAKKKAHL